MVLKQMYICEVDIFLSIKNLLPSDLAVIYRYLQTCIINCLDWNLQFKCLLSLLTLIEI